MHANDLSDDEHLFKPGTAVEFDAEEGDRGMKAARVRVVERAPMRSADAAPRVSMARPRVSDDDDVCEVLSTSDFMRELTEALLDAEPSLTGGQILRIRNGLVDFAEKFGWVEG